MINSWGTCESVGELKFFERSWKPAVPNRKDRNGRPEEVINGGRNTGGRPIAPKRPRRPGKDKFYRR